MYTLREVINNESGQLVSNYFLGNRYTYIHRDTNRFAFNRAFASYFKIEISDMDVPQKPDSAAVTHKAFVSDENGELHAIVGNNEYYIMVANGATFERLN